MDLGLEGRVAVVFGGGGGIGRGIAASLAAEGARVAIADISDEALAQAVAEIEQDVLPVRVDLSDHESITAGLERVVAELGTVSVLVNNTGGPPPGPAAGVATAHWERYFHIMVSSLMHATDLVLPGMRSLGWGRIITSTSYGAIVPIPNLGISNALRPALLGWSKTVAGEVAADGVTVNVVVPGRIATARALEVDRKEAERDGVPVEKVAAASAATIPVGRYGTVQEYGDVVAFLASDRAGYVTGSVVRVDGGMIPSIF